MMRLVLEVLQRELSSKIVRLERGRPRRSTATTTMWRSEEHFGENLFVTRKGAISARSKARLGIIPGSMGAKSYIVRGLGNAESLCSCSHGAGRRMSRTAAQAQVQPRSTWKRRPLGVECRKDGGVIDEIPGAYKDIDVVMDNQRDLVEVVHTLKQVVCIKG